MEERGKMSRTDKDRPYDVQLHDKTLNIVERHDHSKGECDFFTMEKWKRRFNDQQHKVHGARRLWFTCELSPATHHEFYVLLGPDGADPRVKETRERIKRTDRRTVKRLSHMAARQMRTKRTMEAQDDLGDMLNKPRSSKADHDATHAYHKPKRAYVSRHAWPLQEKYYGPEFNYYAPYEHYRYHRANIKSMHGRPNKATA